MISDMGAPDPQVVQECHLDLKWTIERPNSIPKRPSVIYASIPIQISGESNGSGVGIKLTGIAGAMLISFPRL